MRTDLAGDDARFEAAWRRSLETASAYGTSELATRLASRYGSDTRRRDVADDGVQAALVQLWRDHGADR